MKKLVSFLEKFNTTSFFKKTIVPNLFDYIVLITGCFFIAISFNSFLYPNKIASGGIPGLSIILYKLFRINSAYLQFYINVPLFFIGLLKFGGNFGIKTMIGSFAIPTFILLTQGFVLLNSNIIIASILGGVGTGIGLAFIVNGKGAVCGFTLIATILHEYTKLKFSILIMILNSAVIIASSVVIGFIPSFYALISLATTSIVIEVVQNILKSKTLNVSTLVCSSDKQN